MRMNALRRKSVLLSVAVVIAALVAVTVSNASGQGADPLELPSETSVYPDQSLDDPLPPDLEAALIAEGAIEELERLRGIKDGSILRPERVRLGPPLEEDTGPRHANAPAGMLERSLCQPMGFGAVAVAPKICWGQVLDGGDTYLMINIGTRRQPEGQEGDPIPAVDISVTGDAGGLVRADLPARFLDAAGAGTLEITFDEATGLVTVVDAASRESSTLPVCSRMTEAGQAEHGCPAGIDEADHAHDDKGNHIDEGG